MNTNIHHSAIISPEASIADSAIIGPWCIVEEGAVIGERTRLISSVTVGKGAIIGKDCTLYQGAVFGIEPQDLKYDNEPTYAQLGDRSTIREYATIHRGTIATGKTLIGDDCFIMAYCHVAHDCVIGNNIIISNGTQIAGHCFIDDNAIIGGMVKVHQFCSVGSYCMVGADSKITKDVAPFLLVNGNPLSIENVNIIGLRRKGFPAETIAEIKNFFKIVWRSGYNTTDGINAYIEQAAKPLLPEIEKMLHFIRTSQRGIAR